MDTNQNTAQEYELIPIDHSKFDHSELDGLYDDIQRMDGDVVIEGFHLSVKLKPMAATEFRLKYPNAGPDKE